LTLSPSNGHRNGDRPVIGLGLMDYYGQHQSPQDGERIYQQYIGRMARFAAWLLERGYSLVPLIGNLSYDTRAKHDLLRILAGTGSVAPGRIIDKPVSSPEQLYALLAQTDLVIATRFHNVLLALMLNKPVLALSYHEKVRSLMAGVGAEDYCHDATDLDVPRLIEQFGRLEENAETVRSSLKAKTDGYHRALDEQYRNIFNEL
jgi:polysaccharide pyruvyl transferase WcaK-like protein